MRCWIQRMKKRSADKAFVWSKKLELAMYKREEFLFERRFTKAGVISNGGDRVIDFFFKEEERNVFFRPEIVKDCPFGDPGFTCNCFSGGCLKAFGLKESKCGFNYSVTNRLFILVSLASRLPTLAGFR